MSEPMTGLSRTHGCGDLRLRDVGSRVTLMGWVHRRRDLGGLIFVDLRDRSGSVQVVFNPQEQADVFKKAETLRGEFVVAVVGDVAQRPQGTVNLALASGEVEVRATALRVLNVSRSSPINIAEDQTVEESLRLKYRFLDLRRPTMQKKVIMRHRVAKAVRDHMDSQGFLEIETPMLVRSTPEGARDYLVPSRVNPGKFYALPQSPQLFKQILMVSGLEKYFQIARCFRDEDLRADRQPEFTQIDIEMSFVEQEDVFRVVEGMLAHVFRTVLDYELPRPFPRLTHAHAMDRYGIDKPDTRFGMEFVDVSDLLTEATAPFILAFLEGDGMVKAMRVPGMAGASRKELDDLGAQVKSWGGGGLLSISRTEEGLKSSVARHVAAAKLDAIVERAGAEPGDLVVMMGGRKSAVLEPMGKLRLELGRRQKLIPEGRFNWLWIVDFPLLKFNAEEQRFEAEHHPFTSPLPEDAHLLETEPLKVRAAAYDVVLNGNELGSGSVRIHQRALQEKIFKAIGLTPEEANLKFGFLLEAFEYGAPPHGGIAVGLDRLVALMAGVDSIREVVVFPKNQSAVCPLTGAPVEVAAEQLDLLRIQVKPNGK